jgi:hypothetical protein
LLGQVIVDEFLQFFAGLLVALGFVYLQHGVFKSGPG